MAVRVEDSSSRRCLVTVWKYVWGILSAMPEKSPDEFQKGLSPIPIPRPPLASLIDWTFDPGTKPIAIDYAGPKNAGVSVAFNVVQETAVTLLPPRWQAGRSQVQSSESLGIDRKTIRKLFGKANSRFAHSPQSSSSNPTPRRRRGQIPLRLLHRLRPRSISPSLSPPVYQKSFAGILLEVL